MNIIEAIAYCKTSLDDKLHSGWVWADDDDGLFWSNIRPSIQEDGYWGNKTRQYEVSYLGTYTGNKLWTQTLHEF